MNSFCNKSVLSAVDNVTLADFLIAIIPTNNLLVFYIQNLIICKLLKKLAISCKVVEHKSQYFETV